MLKVALEMCEVYVTGNDRSHSRTLVTRQLINPSKMCQGAHKWRRSVTTQDPSYEEMMSRLDSGNACHHSGTFPVLAPP
jgi:hypothetical protein